MKNDINIRSISKEKFDKELERKLRPDTFTEFYGQESVVENLIVFIKAAKMRSEPLDHVLLHGPPGLGKTTLAHIIAKEMGSEIKITSGPVIEKPGDLAGILTSIEKNGILFIDEIHRLSPVVEEYLYSAMEDFRIDIILDKGPNARNIQLKLNPFTLIGATTRSGLLTNPLRERFGIRFHLEYYSSDVLQKIVIRSAQILNTNINKESSYEIARRSRGTPRIANALLKRVRDFAMVKNNGIIDLDITNHALDSLKIDKYGLDEMDHKILLTIIQKFNGGPVGLNTISAAINEDADTIEEVYEPFLVKEGFIKRTPRGREATPLAYNHLGIKKGPEQQFLF